MLPVKTTCQCPKTKAVSIRGVPGRVASLTDHEDTPDRCFGYCYLRTVPSENLFLGIAETDIEYLLKFLPTIYVNQTAEKPT